MKMLISGTARQKKFGQQQNRGRVTGLTREERSAVKRGDLVLFNCRRPGYEKGHGWSVWRKVVYINRYYSRMPLVDGVFYN